MTDLSMLTTNLSQYEINQSERIHSEGIRTAQHATNSQLLNVNNRAQPIPESSLIAPLTIERIVHSNQSNCINELNIIISNIKQLKSEAASQIFKYLKLVTTKCSYFDQDNEQKKGDGDKWKEIEKAIEISIEQYVVMLLIQIKKNLLNNQISQVYKVIAIFQLLNARTLRYKQILSFIPYHRGIPLDGQSEFINIDNNGTNVIKTFSTRLALGGFCYSKDWLSMEVSEENSKNGFQKLIVSHGSIRMTGYSIIYDPEGAMVSEPGKQSLHLSGIANYW
jgi:hypothetical protein